MPIFNVAVLVGSHRRDSINRRLAKALVLLAPPALRCTTVRIDDLPFYLDDPAAPRPAPVDRFVQACAHADAALFVTPEFNRSLPAVLKNAIDWASKPKDRNAWHDKPVASSGASPGAIGTAAAQLHLRQVMGAVGAHVMGGEAYVSFKPGLIDDEGHVNDEATREFLRAYMARFARFVACVRAQSPT